MVRMFGLSLSSFGQEEGAAPLLCAKYKERLTYWGLCFTASIAHDTCGAGSKPEAPVVMTWLVGIRSGPTSLDLTGGSRFARVFTELLIVEGDRSSLRARERVRVRLKATVVAWESTRFPGLEAPPKGVLGRTSRRTRVVTGKVGRGLR